jgi:transcriptional regulator with XRE-family HTH domain
MTTPTSLRERRKAMGLTQQQLAEALAVPMNTVARWEQGAINIAHPRVLELALIELQRQLEIGA